MTVFWTSGKQQNDQKSIEQASEIINAKINHLEITYVTLFHNFDYQFKWSIYKWFIQIIIQIINV